ncbi:hypothetical protein HYH02_010255 [Chlamydomonas schloesseri]|uniref:Uncharacterized protein n=1 Tax=Chlamydomonas schloesseri TaxID=2026947 RepID=A0A835TL74_9CHLO|nr:hypothetical protein HYH02_010255 [Chlamydomonas schloesseri]|eukprot:KAG2440676.1 hypothetical protein HYH02_010255 [Chlamydomonas schloesseri]
MEWNLRTARGLAQVHPLSFDGQLISTLRGAGQEAAQEAPSGGMGQLPGVLCPWLPNAAALRALLDSGFAVAGVECGAAAVERLVEDLGLGPEETGVHDGWTRRALLRPHAAAAAPATSAGNRTTAGSQQSPRLFVYRGNPYLLTPPVLSLFPYALTGVWDAWGLMVTPPQLLWRYAAVWAEVLPRGGTWLAVALLRDPSTDGQELSALQRAGLHAHSIQSLVAVAEHEGFAVEQLAVPATATGHAWTDGAGSSCGAAGELAARQVHAWLREVLGVGLLEGSSCASETGGTPSGTSALRLVVLAMTKR